MPLLNADSHVQILPRVGEGGGVIGVVSSVVDRVDVQIAGVGPSPGVLDHARKRNDTTPIELVLTERVGEVWRPVDLTGWSDLRFVMRASGATAATVNASASPYGDPTAGRIRYEWADADVNTAGKFLAEVTGTDAAGFVRTFPGSSNSRLRRPYLVIQILEDLDNG